APSVFLAVLLGQSISPLFPYTTLFRSSPTKIVARIGVRPDFAFSASTRVNKSASICFANARPSRTNATAFLPSVDMNQFCTFYRSEEHTSELQSRENLVCRLLLEKNK